MNAQSGRWNGYGMVRMDRQIRALNRLMDALSVAAHAAAAHNVAADAEHAERALADALDAYNTEVAIGALADE